ncbi:hypothetical protein CEUSTIGMA_g10026.t1 [Chlamydomonas eustigma]|uniref:Photosystem II PsbY protein n=1 Tax=Chlamydomonas eustigma TaxID=1157962 RepID=A0A250XII5_9CHLO|nr:hypothetical protein CEUSTIGMA_g10026.t1 [Chlamydomonas eustigma]|eukprot:GAX82600.1 hypothetical protein CEUSTIGMA_g10026.t1 [Chlamydomonas eustigma]
MATMKAPCSKTIASRNGSRLASRPSLSSRCLSVRAVAKKADISAEVTKFVTVSSVAATLLSSGNALAAQEIISVAESDGRLGVIAALFVPALGWVGFNMLQPALNQLNKMAEERETAQRGVISAVGLGAAASMLLLADSASAASEVAQVAESDARLLVIAGLFVPAIAWVGFNMLQPALNQLNKMAEERENAKRSIVSALGLGAAALLMAGSADAATEVAQLAESDGRLGVIATLFVPALGWVGFNMLQPALNQLNKMVEDREAAQQ